MTKTLSYSGTLVQTTCWCGMRHAIPQELHDHIEAQHRDGREQDGVYCPLGHSWIFSGEGEAAKLRRRLEAEKDRAATLAAQRDQAEASRRAQKAATTRAKKRHAAAVCPCCKRSFKQLRRHMASQHPDFDPESSGS